MDFVAAATSVLTSSVEGSDGVEEEEEGGMAGGGVGSFGLRAEWVVESPCLGSFQILDGSRTIFWAEAILFPD